MVGFNITQPTLKVDYAKHKQHLAHKINIIVMLGDNPVRPPVSGPGDILAVKKIFKTLQGEGPNVGTPSIFIRLGGCNLTCSFCDTDFEDFYQISVVDIINQVKDLSLNAENKRSVNLVVITGGEPLRQPIELLCKELIAKNYLVQIETNGTLYRDLPSEVEIICSPKIVNSKYYPIREDLLARITAFKFIISTNQGAYSVVPDLRQDEYNIPVYVQAMDEQNIDINVKNKRLAVEIAINKGYRLSYQIHKELGIE